MDDTLKLIGLIYDSVAEAWRWSVFLEHFALAAHAKYVSLAVGDPRWDEFAFSCRYGMSDEDLRQYLALLDDDDPFYAAARILSEGTVRASHEVWDEQEMAKSTMYQQFMGPRDWHYGMAGVFWVTDTSRSVIAMLRGKADGLCGERDLSLLRALVPHLRCAAKLHGELTSLRSQRAAFTDHLDRFPQAFVLTDHKARVLFANAAAKRIIGLRDGLRTEAGRLVASSFRENTALQDAIREIAVAPDSPPRRMAVTRSSHAPSYRLALMPVQSSRAVPLGVSQPAAAILILDAEAAASPNVAMLQELFSLTPGEARVTASLVQGQSVDEVAASLDVSIETVRTHVRHVLSKTATNRQGELIALVLRTVPLDPL